MKHYLESSDNGDVHINGSHHAGVSISCQCCGNLLLSPRARGQVGAKPRETKAHRQVGAEPRETRARRQVVAEPRETRARRQVGAEPRETSQLGLNGEGLFVSERRQTQNNLSGNDGFSPRRKW